jgi:hypothetical protein
MYRRRGRMNARWCFLLGAIGLLWPAALPGPAGATGSYPGETLSVAQSGPAVAGQAVNFLATGQQTDVNDYAGGFSLDVFEKNPNVDPTCAPDYWDETNNAVTDPSELHFIVGDWEGLGTTFSVPFKAVFDQPGPVLLCAYSTWITDTAASATLTVNVTSATPTVTKPVNQALPRVSRVHNKLRCSRGSWSNSPSSFTYRWLAGGHAVRGDKSPVVSVTRLLRGRQVRCGVIAANSAGTASALSAPVRVR